MEIAYLIFKLKKCKNKSLYIRTFYIHTQVPGKIIFYVTCVKRDTECSLNSHGEAPKFIFLNGKKMLNFSEKMDAK
jgi:hypothetical protein